MTSGLNDESNWVIKSNLTYLADAGTRWSYSNVFQKLIDVVAASSNQTFENYFNAKLKNKIFLALLSLRLHSINSKHKLFLC